MARTVIALATADFDPTEAAVPWLRLSEAGHQVHFATADGAPGACDPEMLSGVLLGIVRALPAHREAYARMSADPRFLAPDRFADLSPDDFDLIVLPGGHAAGMKQYLEDAELQAAVVRFSASRSLVGAICHGGVVLARSVDPATGRSVIAGRRVSALPRLFEQGAWLLTVPFRGDYFRTYPEWVESEVRRALGPEGQFEAGPVLPVHALPFVCRDERLITARWPGDAERFAAALVEALAEASTPPESDSAGAR